MASLLMVAAPEAVGQGPSRARPLEPMANWFSDRDYPVDAIRREAAGNVRFRVVIDQRGNVESCTVVESSNDPSLDAATCSIISIRGRFEPARDRRGRPVKDTVVSRVRWVLPLEMPPPTLPFEPVRLVTILHATARGEVSCSTNSGGGPGDSISTDCGLFATTGVATMMRAARTDTVLTGIVAIVPQGMEPPAAPRTDYGTKLVEADAALSVAPDGRISACRMARYEAFVPTRRDPFPDICAAYPIGAPAVFETARERGQLRIVHITTSLYLRGNVPGLTR